MATFEAPPVPVFHATREDFEQPFCDYVRKIFRKHPDLPAFKVVPPKGWRARRQPFPDLRKVKINVPIRQHVFGTKGAYRCVFVEQKEMSVAEFKLSAEEEAQRLRGEATGNRTTRAVSTSRSTSSRHHRAPASDSGKQDVEEEHVLDPAMERAFWANVTLNPPMYGADTPTSFFDDKLPYGWNLQNLGDLLKQHKVVEVPGVTTPMTYFGMWRSFFGWHKEDGDLYSVNYLHWGAPKVWYCVPPSARDKFERMAQGLFPELHKACPAFVRHKDILLSPSLLRTYGVPYSTASQQPNEFVVLNAAAYHAGFNAGFNCAEAVNFGMREWIPIGKEARPCKCSALKDAVRISMTTFDPKWHDPWETESDSESGSDSDSEPGSDSDDDSIDESSGSGSDEAGSSDAGSDSDDGEEHSSSENGSSDEHDHNGGDSDEEEGAGKKHAKHHHHGHGHSCGKCGGSKAAAAATSKSRKAAAKAPAAGAAKGKAGAAGAAAAAAAAAGSTRRGRPPKEADDEQPAPKRARAPPAARMNAIAAGKRVALAVKPRSAVAAAAAALKARHAAAAAAGELLVGPPVAILGEEPNGGSRFFYLCQRISRRAATPGCVLLRWLKEGRDGLYRPVAGATWEEREASLVPVRAQAQPAEGGGGAAAQSSSWKLLTPKQTLLTEVELRWED